MSVFQNYLTKVDLIATSAITLNGTDTPVIDGVNVANNMIIYPAANVAAEERALYDTGADFTQPWTKIEDTQFSLMSTNVALLLYAKQGNFYGGRPVNMFNVLTGALSFEAGNPVLGSIDATSLQTSAGLVKEVQPATIASILAGDDSGVLTLNFDSTTPFTDLTKLRVTNIATKGNNGSILVANVQNITLTSLDVVITNIGTLEATDVSSRVTVIQSVL